MIVNDNDIWVMLLSTIRYSMGRMSYMPSYCVDLYHSYKKALTKEQRLQIAEEINQELKIAESHNKTLGAKYDHETWLNLAAQISKEEG